MGVSTLEIQVLSNLIKRGSPGEKYNPADARLGGRLAVIMRDAIEKKYFYFFWI